MRQALVGVEGLVEGLGGLVRREHVAGEGGFLRVAPETIHEIAAALRFADGHGVAVSPWGGGTKQGWGSGERATVALEMRRMNRVLEHTWEDLTCRVQAGCTWGAMQEELGRHGQFVALDPLWPETATVGGIAAANDSGALRLKYGSLRDLIIGMTVVLADGTIAKTGGKVVKNVAGYDLHKLMTGGFGTLGVIAEVNFRLHAVPRHARSFTVLADGPETLGALMIGVLGSHLATQAMQLRSEGEGFALDVMLAAMAEVVADQAGMLEAMAGEMPVAEAAADVWDARQRIFEDEDAVVLKATMLPASIAEFAGRMKTMGGVSVTQATGVMTAAIPVAAAGEVVALRKRLARVDGSLTILRQPPGMTMERWGVNTDTLPLMRELKRQFDPKNTLNPGRFVGGI